MIPPDSRAFGVADAGGHPPRQSHAALSGGKGACHGVRIPAYSYAQHIYRCTLTLHFYYRRCRRIRQGGLWEQRPPGGLYALFFFFFQYKRKPYKNRHNMTVVPVYRSMAPAFFSGAFCVGARGYPPYTRSMSLPMRAMPSRMVSGGTEPKLMRMQFLPMPFPSTKKPAPPT